MFKRIDIAEFKQLSELQQTLRKQLDETDSVTEQRTPTGELLRTERFPDGRARGTAHAADGTELFAVATYPAAAERPSSMQTDWPFVPDASLEFREEPGKRTWIWTPADAAAVDAVERVLAAGTSPFGAAFETLLSRTDPEALAEQLERHAQEWNDLSEEEAQKQGRRLMEETGVLDLFRAICSLPMGERTRALADAVRHVCLADGWHEVENSSTSPWLGPTDRLAFFERSGVRRMMLMQGDELLGAVCLIEQPHLE